MAPVDLLSLLNAPFAMVKQLQVSALTNALVAACAEVVADYVVAQRTFVHSIGDDTIHPAGDYASAVAAAVSATLAATSGTSGGSHVVAPTVLPPDGPTAACAVCAVINNSERTIELLESLLAHIDRGGETEEEVEAAGGGLEDLSLAEGGVDPLGQQRKKRLYEVRTPGLKRPKRHSVPTHRLRPPGCAVLRLPVAGCPREAPRVFGIWSLAETLARADGRRDRVVCGGWGHRGQGAAAAER